MFARYRIKKDEIAAVQLAVAGDEEAELLLWQPAGDEITG